MNGPSSSGRPNAPGPSDRPTPLRSRSGSAAGRLLRPVGTLAALLYFLLDALAYWVVRPVLHRIAQLPVFARIGRRIGAWIAGLAPYPSLLLVLVPLALLEPAKPVGAWLFAIGRPWSGAAVIAGAELVKITLVERLFHIAKPKLLTIGWFARGYGRVTAWLSWLKETAPVRAARRLLRGLRRIARRFSLMVRRAAGR
ncbi:hypothetical protein A6A40_24760 (plasmid) [Azospirillum humicireducens]|uniref:Uncharacterized protein n=1 Tax=Azospirillum humicireducens TaxID=1226968 RepID=A0A2R4VV20_9PROT|nr:hypothetical protein [Azospirillum humicireducens]AWB08262.1 hypothetical protein A6A40_24760 [Azospirillum humicireducens]